MGAHTVPPATLLDQPEVVRDVRLEPGSPTQALAAPATAFMATFERIARDPSIDVDKLDRLMQMHERIVARDAEAQFNAAMTDAQTEMRPVNADAYNPQTKSRYASYKGLDDALRPIYTRYGFGHSFSTTDAPIAEHVRVICQVSHRAGHSRQYQIDMPADGKGAKGGDVMTKTHATGSAVSYGMRYLLKMIWNVAVGESDDDGNRASAKPQPVAPEGYADWLTTFIAKADEGFAALQGMWNTANRDQRLKPFADHLAKTDPKGLAALKQKAREVKG